MTDEAKLRSAAIDLLADAHLAHQEMNEREALGWLVVVFDNDTGTPKMTHAYMRPTVEEAVILAGKMDADPRTGTNPVDGEPGWSHVVIPLFDADKDGVA